MQKKLNLFNIVISSNLMIFILAFIVFPSISNSKNAFPVNIPQGIVPDMIHVDPEPGMISALQTVQQAFQINPQQNHVYWDSISNLTSADNKFCNIQLKPGEVSNILLADGFKFKIPQGSEIQQVRIHIQGKMLGTMKPAVVSFGLTDKNLIGIGTEFYHKSGQGNAWPANGSSGSWYYTPNQTGWINELKPDSVNANDWKIQLILKNPGTENLQISIDQISLEIVYLPLYTLMKGQIGKAFLNISFIDSLASKYTYAWDLPEGGSVYNEFRYGSMISFAMGSDSFGIKQVCVHIQYPNGTIQTLCRDFLYVRQPPTTLSVFVWHDQDANGLQDENEPGIQGQTLEIIQTNGNTVKTLVSDETGVCFFEMEKGGTFYLKWSPDNHFMPTLNNTSGDSTLDNNLFQQGEIFRTQAFSLKKFDQKDHIDIGLIKPGKISGHLWHDHDGNGQKDQTEAVLQLNVVLFENDSSYRQLITDETGKFEFDKLRPGTYTCCFDRPAGSILPQNSSYLVGNEESDLLTCSQTIQIGQDYHATNSGTGIVFPGYVSGKIWLDENENGTIEPGENAIPGIGVRLLESPSPAIVHEVFSDENGLFEFHKIYAGSYVLEIKDQSIYTGTMPQASADTAINSYFVKSDSSYYTYEFAIFSGTEKPYLNAGFIYKKASIGGRVWLDENGNGKQDNPEPGFDGIAVQLFDNEGNNLQTVNTESNEAEEKGHYRFVDIAPGSYYVKFEIPDVYVPTLSFQELLGSESVITGQNGAFTSDIFHVLPDENKRNLFAGLVWNYAKITGRIWGDNNENGLQDIGERGISDVQLQLINQQDEVVSQTFTGNEMQMNLGLYTFENIIPGNYYLTMIPNQADYIPTLYQTGNQTESDSDFERHGEIIRTDWLVLNPGSVNNHIDGGLIMKDNSVSGIVWHDENGDGLKNEEGRALNGVKVKLFRDNGAEIAQRFTDSEGKYLFNELSIGRYYIQFLPDDAWLFTISYPEPYDLNSDADHNNGLGTTKLMELSHGQHITDIDAGLIPHFAGLQTYVWLDANENGLQDAEESGVGDILVKLYDSGGGLVQEKLTLYDGSDAGKCHFEQVMPGIYYFVYELPQKYKGTVYSAGDPGLNSDIFTENGVFRTAEFYLAGGTTLTDFDAGLLIRYAVVGDYIWLDSNRNGRQDDGEAGQNELVVGLFNDSGEQVGNTISKANEQTGEAGFYRFEQVLPGNYFIKLSIPGVNEMTVNRPEHGELNSKLTGRNGIATTDMFTVNYGDSIYFMDMGLILKTATVGNFVWVDANRNGLQDPGESGLNGVLLTLLDNDEKTVQTAQSRFNPATGQHGFYRLESLEPGDYKIRISIPGTMQLSPKGMADAWLDSDAFIENSETGFFRLEPGQSNDDIDFGLSFKTSSLGDYIWQDLNENGLQDADEPGLDSIMLHLYDETGELVMTAESHFDVANQKNGLYYFKEINPGAYVVKVEIPAGYLPSITTQVDPALNSDFTHQNGFGSTDLFEIGAGVERYDIDFGLLKVVAQLGDKVWLDVNKNGIQEVNETGINGIQIRLFNETGEWIRTTWSGNHPVTGEPGYWSFYNLAVGYYYVRFVIPVEYSNSKAYQGNNATLDCDITHKNGPGTTDMLFLPDSYHQLDIDAGLYLETYSSIGDFVWEDLNGNDIQDADEPGLNGVTIILYNENGVQLRQTKTKSKDNNQQGHYLFDYLPNGKYYIKIIVPPGNYVVSPFGGGDPAKDSDITHMNGPYTTSVISLGVKQNQSDVDIGLFSLGSVKGFAWEDLDGNGLKNEEEPGINQVYVELFDDESNLIASAFTEKDFQTEANGIFNFDFLDPGMYFLRFYPGEATEFTCFNAGDDALDSDITNENGPGSTSLFLLQSGQTNSSMGAGISSGGSGLSGIVWQDINGDGLKQSGETGMNGYRVSLMRGDGSMFSFLETYPHNEVDGYFEFFSVPNGSYYLAFENREDHLFSQTAPQTGQQGSIVTNQYGPGTSDLFEISSVVEMSDLNCGVFRPAKISGFVWYDSNQDGIQNEDEQGVAGVSVSLTKNIYDESGHVMTNSEGYYAFEGLLQHVYQVQVSAPLHYGFTVPGQGNDGTIDSDVSSDGRSPLITVNHGEKITHINAGLVTVSNLISGYVVTDPDGDDPDQPIALGGISFYLQDDSGNNRYHARSDKNGYYQFYNLPAGKYRVKAMFNKNMVVKPAYKAGSDQAFNEEGYSNWLNIRVNSKIDDQDLVLTPPSPTTEDQKLIRILPNPAQKTARFETNFEGQVINRIILFDLAGNQLLDEKVDFKQSGYIELDISFLPGGLYRVYAFVSDKAVSQKLFYKADE